MNVLVFDIETVPDVELGRRIHGLEGLDDAQVAKAMYALRRQENGSDFLPLEQHRVVAISCLLRSREQLKVWTLGDLHSSEAELIARFFDGLQQVMLAVWPPGGVGLAMLLLNRRRLWLAPVFEI